MSFLAPHIPRGWGSGKRKIKRQMYKKARRERERERERVRGNIKYSLNEKREEWQEKRKIE